MTMYVRLREPKRQRRQGVSVSLLFAREARPPVYVQHAEGEAKFWIEPAVELHANYGLKAKRLAEAQELVEEHAK